MAKHAFGQKVSELCVRRGIDPSGVQTGLAKKLDEAGYGEALGIQHTRNHLSRAMQRQHLRAVTPPAICCHR